MKQKIIAFLLAIIALLGGGYTLGSVERGHEYQATTTSAGRFNSGPTTLCTTGGVLGSVVITGAAAGVINFFNATTSHTGGRAASSSILLASIPASAAAMTHTYDAVAPIGLLVDIAGTMPTTTITYRCN